MQPYSAEPNIFELSIWRAYEAERRLAFYTGAALLDATAYERIYQWSPGFQDIASLLSSDGAETFRKEFIERFSMDNAPENRAPERLHAVVELLRSSGGTGEWVDTVYPVYDETFVRMDVVSSFADLLDSIATMFAAMPDAYVEVR